MEHIAHPERPAMPDLESQISTELTRIVASPYPVSLSKLAQLLGQAESPTVRKCINDRPVWAIARLAATTITALPLWPFALDALQSLCCCSLFRDELLVQNPALLDALLTKAGPGASGCDFDKYFNLCVLLLSEPLPDPVLLPASAHSFFLRAFQRATKKPCVATLKPVYSMLNGACRGLLAHLPSEVRLDFEKELSTILSSESAKQDALLLLWCFGIVILAESSKEAGRTRSSTLSVSSTPDQVNNGPESRWKTSAGRKLFGSAESMLKTINLTSLSVIWACRGETGVPDGDALEAIRIATRTLQFVNSEVRQNWSTASPLGRSVPAKLMSKLLRKDIHTGVQLQGMCFLGVLLGSQKLPREITTQYEKSLETLSNLELDPETLRETLGASLPSFAPLLGHNSIRYLLQGMLQTCARSTSSLELKSSTILVDALAAEIPTCSALRSNILLAISSEDLREAAHSFLGVSAAEASQTNTRINPSSETTSSILHRNLASAVTSLLLTSALAARSDEAGLDQRLSAALVNKQRQLTLFPASNTHAHLTNMSQPSVSIFEQACTQAASHPQDWRERISSELERHNSYQRDTIVRAVSQICQDLESRCDNVEAPLRQERQKVKELEVKVGDLTKRIKDLEAEALDRNLVIDGLEDERAQVEADLDQAEESNRVMSAAMEQVKEDLADATRRAEETLRAAQEGFNAKEVEFRTNLLNQEEILQKRCKEIEDLRETINRLEDKIQKADHDAQDMASAQESLKTTINTLQHELESERKLNFQHEDAQESLKTTIIELEEELEAERELHTQQEHDISRLEARNEELSNILESTKAEVQDLTAQLASLQSLHQETLRTAEEAQRQAELKYTNDMSKANAKAKSELQCIMDELAMALQDGHDAKNAYEECSHELERKEDLVVALQTKVKELSTICLAKEEELQELKAQRKRTLASMGIVLNSPLQSGRSHRLSPTQPDTQETPRPRRHHKTPSKSKIVKEPIHCDPVEPAVDHFVNTSFNSSDSSGGAPTPKRAKYRTSFKVPAMHTPYAKKEVPNNRTVSQKVSSPKRQALTEKSSRGNQSPSRRHTTVGFKFPDNENEKPVQKTREGRRGSLHSLDSVSFDMSGVFSSTQFPPSASAELRGVSEVDADTVTEL